VLPAESRYQDGTYLLDNPDWHDEEAPWKARNIRDIVVRNRIAFTTAVEVGCGNGAILQTLAAFFPQASLVGYEISRLRRRTGKTIPTGSNASMAISSPRPTPTISCF
jgi:tRNA G46 methylase TrmB